MRKFKEGDVIKYDGIGHNVYIIKEVHRSHYVNSLGNCMDGAYTDANFVFCERCKPNTRIGELEKLIKEKESELGKLRQELHELEENINYGNINFLIKCSNDSSILAKNTDEGDILIDSYVDNNGKVHARSGKERREYASDIFLEYLGTGNKYTICTCSDEALNAIGNLLMEYNVIPNNIEVLMFSKEHPEGKVSHYTREGYLTNWEIGFLG